MQHLTTRDQGRWISLSRKISHFKSHKKSTDKLEQQIQQLALRSKAIVEKRASLAPKVKFETHLPISKYVAEIKSLLANNQVLVLAGETGSGKTTQLPKICLEAGFGARGIIGHTQPRRVAATSVSARIAEELNSELGQTVGVAVRFYEKTAPQNYIKVMTDGMLLAEFQRDPWLSHYEVIIIDEAHERSINIDFLLGLLKNLLPKRKDLKLIITSATIDLERFSQFFNNAPILSVEGRTYPVETKYLDEFAETLSEEEAISEAVQEIVRQGPGDILIFLAGEGEIRSTVKALRKLQLQQTEILPLYARLSIKDQQRVFKSVQGRKIVLATNVAETSLTVPGIRFVIDPGNARISRFSMRSKIQRLQVEKVSKASANQRKGRCGRVSAGVCYRLYTEQDFESRDDFTLPEIKRTNLASVILQMKLMGIEQIENFPFIDTPDEKKWREGFNLLFELGALDKQNQLTALGKNIATLPIDPKLAVFIYAGQQNALKEMLVIASLYSVREPRERPHDKAQKADQIHAQWNDKKSDFITYLNLWNALHQAQDDLSNKQFKQFCFDHMINFTAWLDWRNTFRQLKSLVNARGLKFNKTPADYEQIHQGLIPALLSNLLVKTNEPHYQGARNTKIFVHPSSINFSQKPNWLVAAELMETQKLYARTTGQINVEWIETAAEHLCKQKYLEPHWRKKSGSASAYLQKSIFGQIYVANRLVDYSSIEPKLSRQWLIEKGLIEGEIDLNAPFHKANQQLFQNIKELEEQQRRTDIIRSTEELAEIFEQKLPDFVINAKTLKQWLKQSWHKHNKILQLTESDAKNLEAELDQSEFPQVINVKGTDLELEYKFEPGHPDDGVSICIPLPMLRQFKMTDFEWLVPGLLEEKILCSIKALPKSVRKNFIPAPHFAKAAYERLVDNFGEGDFFIKLAEALRFISGKQIDISDWEGVELPTHLTPNFKVFDRSAIPVKKARDLAQLQNTLDNKVKQSLQNVEQLEVDTESQSTLAKRKQEKTSAKITEWQAEKKFPLELNLENQQQKTRVLRALKDYKSHVELVGCESFAQAKSTHLMGVARLMLLNQDSTYKYFLRKWQHRNELNRFSTFVNGYDDLVDQLALSIAIEFIGNQLIEDYKQFNSILKRFANSFSEQMNDVLTLILSLLKQTQKISKRVYEQVEPKFLSSYLDIRAQLDFLWPKSGFALYGIEQLKQYPRYLSALEFRLERMDINFPRESANLKQLKQLEKSVERYPRDPHFKTYDDAVVTLLWMMQEYRISLFAQGQKTAYPISEKRIKKFIDEIAKLR